MSSSKRTLLYAGSFLIPPFGIILGLVYLTKKDNEHRSVGTWCLGLGILGIFFLRFLTMTLLVVDLFG